MELDEFIQDAIRDRLEGWELVEFLQVSVEDILQAALDNDWVDEENINDLLDYVGLKNGD